LGYLMENGKKTPISPIHEILMYGRLEDWGFQSAPYPEEYSHFLFEERVPKDEFLSYLNIGDKKVYNGFVKSSYKNVIPQVNIGIDIRLFKKLFLSLDIFGRLDQLNIQEEGYIFNVKDIIAGWTYTEYPNTPNQHLVTDWQLDLLVGNIGVNYKAKILSYGLMPTLKYEVPLTDKLSITPKAGVMIGRMEYQVKADLFNKSLYPADYLKIFEDNADIYYPSEITMTGGGKGKNFSFFSPIVGLDIGKKFYLTTEIQFNVGKKIEEPLLYSSGNKIKFPEIAPALNSKGEGMGLKENYGVPQNDDFIHLDKIRLFKVGVGIKF